MKDFYFEAFSSSWSWWNDFFQNILGQNYFIGKEEHLSWVFGFNPCSGHGPRLSKVNLFTLLSLWMEMFPREEEEEEEEDSRQVSVGTSVSKKWNNCWVNGGVGSVPDPWDGSGGGPRR